MTIPRSVSFSNEVQKIDSPLTINQAKNPNRWYSEEDDSLSKQILHTDFTEIIENVTAALQSGQQLASERGSLQQIYEYGVDCLIHYANISDDPSNIPYLEKLKNLQIEYLDKMRSRTVYHHLFNDRNPTLLENTLRNTSIPPIPSDSDIPDKREYLGETIYQAYEIGECWSPQGTPRQESYKKGLDLIISQVKESNSPENVELLEILKGIDMENFLMDPKQELRNFLHQSSSNSKAITPSPATTTENTSDC
jgi:hypothetical protein